MARGQTETTAQDVAANATSHRRSVCSHSAEKATVYTEEELNVVTDRYASKVASCIRSISEKNFGLGRLAYEMHQELLDDAKRVPDNEDSYRRLASKLKRKEIYKVSDKRLRSLAKAYEIREELGGKGNAPDLPVDHYVEIANRNLKTKDRRELLDVAVEKKLAVPALRKLVKVRLGELDPDACKMTSDRWPGEVEKLVTCAASAICQAYTTTADLQFNLSECTRERIEHLAILTYQFAKYRPEVINQKENAV